MLRYRFVRVAGLACTVLLGAAALAVAVRATAEAAAEAHYAGSSARLVGRLAMEKRTFGEFEQTLPIFRLDNPVSLLRRSEYPGDGLDTEATEILLRGDLAFQEFVSCRVAAIGALDFQRVDGLPAVEMQVQRLECRDTGRGAGTVTPDLPSANVRQDLYGCEASPGSSVWLVRKWAPYSDVDQDTWKAADLLMRDDVSARWPYDLLRSLALRLTDARARLAAAFPETDSEWDFAYVPALVEVELTPELRAALDAVEVEDNRIRRLPTPVDPGLEKVCEAVCGCTIILDGGPNGFVSLAFSPTTNLLDAVRRLREVAGIRSARLVRRPDYAGPGRQVRSVLRVRTLPAALHFTLESTDALSGETTRRYFVVDDENVREVSAQEASRLLSFEPPSIPPDIWQ